MITAVDTNVLLDIFIPSDQHGPWSREQLTVAYNAGALVICDIVYAELVAFFGERGALDRALQQVNIALSSIESSIAYEAGLRWMHYHRAGGPRRRILADFLIGAHAVSTAGAFLTRDRGFYATYFPELKSPEVP